MARKKEITIKMPNIVFAPEAEKEAIKLAAYDILKQLCQDGRITQDELRYIAEKHNVIVEK